MQSPLSSQRRKKSFARKRLTAPGAGPSEADKGLIPFPDLANCGKVCIACTGICSHTFGVFSCLVTVLSPCVQCPHKLFLATIYWIFFILANPIACISCFFCSQASTRPSRQPGNTTKIPRTTNCRTQKSMKGTFVRFEFFCRLTIYFLFCLCFFAASNFFFFHFFLFQFLLMRHCKLDLCPHGDLTVRCDRLANFSLVPSFVRVLHSIS